jgi:hypothetical protein
VCGCVHGGGHGWRYAVRVRSAAHPADPLPHLPPLLRQRAAAAAAAWEAAGVAPLPASPRRAPAVVPCLGVTPRGATLQERVRRRACMGGWPQPAAQALSGPGHPPCFRPLEHQRPSPAPCPDRAAHAPPLALRRRCHRAQEELRRRALAEDAHASNACAAEEQRAARAAAAARDKEAARRDMQDKARRGQGVLGGAAGAAAARGCSRRRGGRGAASKASPPSVPASPHGACRPPFPLPSQASFSNLGAASGERRRYREGNSEETRAPAEGPSLRVGARPRHLTSPNIPPRHTCPPAHRDPAARWVAPEHRMLAPRPPSSRGPSAPPWAPTVGGR